MAHCMLDFVSSIMLMSHDFDPCWEFINSSLSWFWRQLIFVFKMPLQLSISNSCNFIRIDGKFVWIRILLNFSKDFYLKKNVLHWLRKGIENLFISSYFANFLVKRIILLFSIKFIKKRCITLIVSFSGRCLWFFGCKSIAVALS